MNLDKLRNKIDNLDTQIIQLLNERTKRALEIGDLKKKNNANIYVPSREREVFEKLCRSNEGPLPSESVKAIYREIMSAGLALQHNLKIAYLGPAATFTHQAARLRFGGSVDYASCSTISDIFSMVENRSADYGVVPVENSSEGAVTHTFDRFSQTSLQICAEIYLPISHHLLARESSDKIERIYSKEEAFGQCRRWLNANMPGVELISTSSTARAAEKVAGESGSAAIAGRLSAELYELEIRAENIQDVSGNTTRFLVLSDSYGPPSGNDKTSIMITLRHCSGTLYDALAVFSRNEINMTKIESRPNKARAWEYNFFVDFEGHSQSENIERMLAELEKHCASLQVLGSYPSMVEKNNATLKS